MSTKLTLEALEVLDSIDRKGSFAAAAAALYRVPSAVTYSVQKLEQDLGISLFRKEGRRSVLTPAGRVLLEQGREILEAAERLVETARQVDSGWESRLNIAVDSIMPVETIYPQLEAFYRLHPDMEINLFEEVLGGSWEAVIEGRADMAVGAGEPPGNTQGLRLRPVGQTQWLFAVAADHPLTELGRPLTEQDIQRYRAVVIRDSSRHLPPLSRRVFDQQPRLSVSSIEQKIALQVRGLGVGYLPQARIGRQLDSGALVALPLEAGAPCEALHIVWKSGNRGRALRWFVEALGERSWPR